MERPNPPLEFEVGDGDPAVLAKVFGPRIHEKSFHVEAGIAGVIEESPADRRPSGGPLPASAGMTNYAQFSRREWARDARRRRYHQPSL